MVEGRTSSYGYFVFESRGEALATADSEAGKVVNSFEFRMPFGNLRDANAKAIERVQSLANEYDRKRRFNGPPYAQAIQHHETTHKLQSLPVYCIRQDISLSGRLELSIITEAGHVARSVKVSKLPIPPRPILASLPHPIIS